MLVQLVYVVLSGLFIVLHYNSAQRIERLFTKSAEQVENMSFLNIYFSNCILPFIAAMLEDADMDEADNDYPKGKKALLKSLQNSSPLIFIIEELEKDLLKEEGARSYFHKLAVRRSVVSDTHWAPVGNCSDDSNFLCSNEFLSYKFSAVTGLVIC